MRSAGPVQSATSRLGVESPEFWRAVADSVPDLVLLVDPAGTLLYVNRAPYGARVEDVIGRSALDFVASESRDELRRSLGEIFLGAAPRMREQRAMHPDGLERWYSTHTAPVRMSDGIVAAVVVARDVTERHRLEERARDWQKMDALGQLAAGIVHDFNNVLAIVGMAAQLITDRAVSPDCARADAETILSEIKRGGALARQLLAFTRRQAPATNDLDLNSVARDVATILRRVIGPRITIAEDLEPEGATLHANRSQMEQIMMNLMLNARDAIADQGEIAVWTRRDESSVRLRVADTGCGMTEETRQRLFEPFFTTKSRTGGTGLGLWTVHSIVTSAGGVIEVSSTPSVGTMFEITFPVNRDE
jgi:PAS domain S-box-containing protein